MKKSSHKKRILIVGLIILLVIVLLSIYREQQIALLDKAEYKAMYKQLETDAETFGSQAEMCTYITSWAKENNLEYTLDNYNNIIFHQDATKKKSKVSPTVIIVNYNYENAIPNRRILASAAMIAKTSLNSGEKTVIFINNENNDGLNYERLSSEYFTSKSKVIYLDYGKSAYVSASSFLSSDQTISVPSELEDVACDTCIKINIGGLNSDCIDTSVSKSVNPIMLFSTVLTRLKSKSMICQLADVKVGNKGKMYPDSIEATIMINSYQVGSLTGYLDKRIKAFEKACKKDMPNAYYTYEIVENEDEYPDQAYTKDSFDALTTVLYALKNGVYRYEKDDTILEGYDDEDIYGIVCVNQLKIEDHQILIDVTSQANSEDVLNDVLADNAACAKLAKCNIKTIGSINGFNNEDTGLISTLKSTYLKVNTLSGTDINLNVKRDTYFTPMSYLYNKNNKMDIVHIKEDRDSASIITNMLLCYIQTKGNFLSL